MDYRRLGDADLADFVKNVVAQLTAGSVKAFDTEISAELAGTFTPVMTPYENAIEAAVQQAAEKLSKTAAKDDLRTSALFKLATVRNYLVAKNASKADFDVCGYNYQKLPSTVVAIAPTDLAASGTSNGVNRLVFNGNNRPNTVTFEIWRLSGDTEPFRLLTTTKRQSFVDSPVTPGQVYNYKVRAVAATNVSAFSNVAVVYGSSR